MCHEVKTTLFKWGSQTWRIQESSDQQQVQNNDTDKWRGDGPVFCALIKVIFVPATPALKFRSSRQRGELNHRVTCAPEIGEPLRQCPIHLAGSFGEKLISLGEVFSPGVNITAE